MPKLVMIMLDSFGYDMLSKENSPFLYQIAKNGFLAKIEPLLAYRGIEPTIFSGLYPDQHNIWLDYYFDPFNSPFKWTYNPFFLFLNYFIRYIPKIYFKKLLTIPICYITKFIKKFTQFPRTTLIPWNLLKNFNISMNKSIIEKNSLGKVQTLFDLLRNNKLKFNFINFPFVHNDNDTMKAFHKIISKRKTCDSYDFNFIRFFDLDTFNHKYGPNSQQINKIIKKTDSYVREIFEAFNNFKNDYIFLIISDHGVVRIKKIFNILACLADLNLRINKDYYFFLDSTLARFYIEKEDIQNKIKNKLDKYSNGHFLTSNEKKELHISNNTIYGNLIYAVNPGTLILPNFYQGTKIVRGMHGYLPSNSELNALFILYGSMISISKSKDRIAFVDILPTILDLLNLTSQAPIMGKSVLKTNFCE